MDAFRHSTRPLACAKQSLRLARQRRAYQTKRYNMALEKAGPAPINFPPRKGFMKEIAPPTPAKIHPPIPIHPSPPPIHTLCPQPLIHLNSTFLSALDPTGARTRLFSASNKDGVKVGDVVLIRRRSGDPFSGTVMQIRRGHGAAEGGVGIDTAVLLRNTLTRVGVEGWFKVFGGGVTGVEVVRRAVRRARRARGTYLRSPRHDPGSVENVVNTYLRQKAGLLGDTTKKQSKSKKDKKGKKH